VFDVLKPTEARSSAAQAANNGQLSDADIEGWIEQRTAAKKARDFKKADEIRGQLLEQGVVLEDTKDGVRWKRK
jgi:cysteinyl-tRNA synthetase